DYYCLILHSNSWVF
nr:immunoglobulin light chain junction region [Macaca mulatta]MOY05295.1 immunoglobulin light chain junction region [Macaca mulatta]MOY05919.1 immunoglobulin light chain junction region [Macaca mulatta]MOY06771.1 immunoglobulin light chain junction region [Macaca mulatta]MOY07866.1 immunoglobulin light chain junction region [Macaca mulatta]